MMLTLAIVISLVALAVLLLGINVFLFSRKFPETEVGRNEHMIRLGVRCPMCEERKTYRKMIRPSDIDPRKLQPDWSTQVK